MTKARDLADLGGVTTRLEQVGNTDGALSNRSLIINGAMQVWQRGTSGFAHNVYSADRWQEFTNTNDGLSISRIEVPSGGETGLPRQLTEMAKFALTAGTTGNLNDLRQKVENPKGLMGQTVTLSYYIKASSSCTINTRRIEFANVTNAPSTNMLPSLNVTTVWQRVVDTVTLNSSDSAVFSASSCLDVILSLPVNTTADVYLTGVQLEVGDTATPFEHRSYSDQLQSCMRYYQVLETGRLMSVGNGSGFSIGSTVLPVSLRAAASINYVYANGSNFAGYSGMSGTQIGYTCTHGSSVAENFQYSYNLNNTSDLYVYWHDFGTGVGQVVVKLDAEL